MKFKDWVQLFNMIVFQIPWHVVGILIGTFGRGSRMIVKIMIEIKNKEIR